ncbi:MAG TPA: hypothetical protein VJQ51_05635 [Burkholderiales bacterium]|nr:hypothetical protein [Burkholderiales bacterium]
MKQPIDVAEEIVQRAEVREQRLVVETRRASARLVPDARKDLPEITPDIDVSGDDGRSLPPWYSKPLRLWSSR